MPKSRKTLRRKDKPSNPINPLSKLTLHKLDWLEKLAIVLSLWFLFYPRPYNLLLGALLIIPILGVLLNGFDRPSIASLVEVTKKEGDYKYDVADFIDMPALVILIRVLLDFEFEDFYSLVLPGTMSAVIIITVLFLTHKLVVQAGPHKFWVYSSLIFNVCLYSYAGCYAANCAFDDSKPEVYKTQVLDKYINRGKRTTYNVRLAPWGHHYDTETIRVSKEQYDETVSGDSVNMDLMKGLFDIPWYYMESKQEIVSR